MTEIHSSGSESANWLAVYWFLLSEREQGVLTMRARGEKLQAIGDVYNFTRERARQIVNECEEGLLQAADPSFRAQMEEVLSSRLAVTDDVIADLVPDAPSEARLVLLSALNVEHPKTWDGELLHYWTTDPECLAKRLDELAALMPLSRHEMDSVMSELQLDVEPAVEDLLRSKNSKIVKHELGWLRANRMARDLAFLWLQAEGSPRSAAEISDVAGISEAAMRERMRRDPEFALVRPDGLWALADWRWPGADQRYSNAEDVVVEVLRESGAMDFDALRNKVRERYPVSDWRIRQCLISSAVGCTPDGKYDLTERGAKPVEEGEPRRPDNMQVSGNIVGVRLSVSHDLMRGSGIAVNRWVTWFLGLRVAPSMRRFSMDQPPGELIVKRSTSTPSISTMRAAVQEMDLVEGCEIVVMLDTENDTAKVVHACSSESCPAFPT